MKSLRLSALLIVCLAIAANPALAQSTDGKNGVTIEIPEFTVKTDGAAAAVTTTGSGSGIQIAENRANRTIECKNEAVNVMGNYNKLTITGTCTGIQVLGNYNHLTIETTPDLNIAGNYNEITVISVSNISLLGNMNKLTWTKGIEKDPNISNIGTKNTITQAAK